MTPYEGEDLVQYWLWQWFVAQRHETISRTKVGQSSVRSCGIHLSSQPHLPGANEHYPYGNFPCWRAATTRFIYFFKTLTQPKYEMRPYFYSHISKEYNGVVNTALCLCLGHNNITASIMYFNYFEAFLIIHTIHLIVNQARAGGH